MINDTIYAVWGDPRNTYLNIWFQQIALSNGSSSVKDLANDVNPIKAYPNPSSNLINLDFGDNELKGARYEVYDVSGKLMISETINNNKQQPHLSRVN